MYLKKQTFLIYRYLPNVILSSQIPIGVYFFECLIKISHVCVNEGITFLEKPRKQRDNLFMQISLFLVFNYLVIIWCLIWHFGLNLKQKHKHFSFFHRFRYQVWIRISMMMTRFQLWSNVRRNQLSTKGSFFKTKEFHIQSSAYNFFQIQWKLLFLNEPYSNNV